VRKRIEEDCQLLIRDLLRAVIDVNVSSSYMHMYAGIRIGVTHEILLQKLYNRAHGEVGQVIQPTGLVDEFSKVCQHISRRFISRLVDNGLRVGIGLSQIECLEERASTEDRGRTPGLNRWQRSLSTDGLRGRDGLCWCRGRHWF
jgi:hypothetical protein